MNKLDEVTSHYKPGSATELENNLVLNWYPKRILKRLEGSAKESILELGIGHGYTTELFNQKFSRHVVIEGSSVVIKLFEEKSQCKNIEVVESYFEEFDTDERFDVILMGFVLEHVEDPEFILKRYKQFLKHGGRLFIAVPNGKSLNRRLGLAMGKIDDIYSLNENDLALGHKRQYCLDTLKSDASAAGYESLWEEGIYLKPLPLGYMQKMPDLDENLQAMLEVGVDYPDLCVGLLLEVGAK